jgi:hypothetical protein
MRQPADASELRCLLSLAIRLRQLAPGTLCQGDRTLYLLAAEALEKHSMWLASTRPDQRTAPADPRLYQPVDLIV